MNCSIIPGEKLFDKTPFVLKKRKNTQCSIFENSTGLFIKDGKFTEADIGTSDVLTFHEQVEYAKEMNLNFLKITFQIINKRS